MECQGSGVGVLKCSSIGPKFGASDCSRIRNVIFLCWTKSTFVAVVFRVMMLLELSILIDTLARSETPTLVLEAGSACDSYLPAPLAAVFRKPPGGRIWLSV